MTQEKNQVFTKLFDIYDLTSECSDLCPSGCSLCENKETLMLLPFEDEYICSESGKDQRDMYLKNQNGHCYQPPGFSCSNLGLTGACRIYQVRPFDCRSFPIVPKFGPDHAIDFYLAGSYCPLIDKLPEYFIRTTIECWESIFENLPNDWKNMYNRLNEHNYSNQIIDSGFQQSS